MFMLPFFQFTDKKAARNLLKYRINTLPGAQRKAKEFCNQKVTLHFFGHIDIKYSKDVSERLTYCGTKQNTSVHDFG